MAQNKADSPLVIYNTLIANATFMAAVGTYDFTGGPTGVPAISVTTPNKPIPNLIGVSGLEVLIHDVGTVRYKNLYEEIEPLTTWNIYLILYSDGNGENLTTATQQIVSTFQGSRSIATAPIADTPGLLVQALVQVPDNALIII